MQLRIVNVPRFNHNIRMIPRLSALFLCAALLPSLGWAQVDEEFEMKRRNLEERFEDYYTRQVLLEREAAEREKGKQEKSEERQRESAEKERYRQQFVLERRKTPELDPSLHEKELAERKKEYEKNREEFVRRMQTLKRLEQEATIPGEEELGIEMPSTPENL